MTSLMRLVVLALTISAFPISAHAGTANTPWQCTSTSVSLYDYGPSVAESCGYTTYPLDHVVQRLDGGKDFVYNVQGNQVVMPLIPANFDPTAATPEQLAYYGYPPKPVHASDIPRWTASLAALHPTVPTNFLIEFNVAAGGVGGTSPCAPINLCWGGYVNTGATFTHAYMDFTEPGQASTACNNDAVSAWTGLGGADGGDLGQAGTLPYTPGFTAHTAFWEVWPEVRMMAFNFSTNRGDDVQAHVDWDGANNRFQLTVWDTTTGSQRTTYYSNPTNFREGSSEFIVERPQYQDLSGNWIIYPLRNFLDGFNVKSGQSNNVGMQNFPLTRYNIINKSGTTLATTNANSGQSFATVWNRCG